ncbi:MAG: hypothetical protein ABR598_02935 [Candidatus Dormibacteria bacterium]
MPEQLTPLRTVQVGDLEVTMATTDELRAEAKRLLAEAAELRARATRLRGEAVAVLVEAGMMLVAGAREWESLAPEAAAQLEEAARAIKVMEEQDGGLDAAAEETRSGLASLFSRKKKAPVESDEARRAGEERALALRVTLAELGRSYGDRLPAATPAYTRALNLEEQSAADIDKVPALQAAARALADEATDREASRAALGFDARHTAALLMVTPPPPVESPLALRGSEQAYLVEAAELGRRKNMSSPAEVADGMDFPVGRTGVPYQLGMYRSRPIPQDTITRLDTGKLVVTNERLGFVGPMKSFSCPLTGLLQVVQFTDGLTLLREGRDHADVLLTPAASRILFYINWAMQPPGGPGASTGD